MARLNDSTRKAVVQAMLQNHWNYTRTAATYNIHRSTVRKWHNRYKQGQPMTDLRRAGRMPILKQRDLDYARRLAAAKHTCREIREGLREHHSKYVSLSTLRRALRSGRNPRTYRALKHGYFMSNRNKSKRSAFCRTHGKDATYHLVSVDACVLPWEFTNAARAGRRRAWHCAGAQPGSDSRSTQHPVYLCVYGAVASTGARSPLIIVSQATKIKVPTSEEFKTVLAQLVQWMGTWQLGTLPPTLLLDNARCHTSKATIAHMSQRHISYMFNPPQSPDLNPIENVWAAMKARLADMNHGGTLQQFIRNCRKAWEEVPDHYIRNIYLSLRSRREKVVSLCGGGPVA